MKDKIDRIIDVRPDFDDFGILEEGFNWYYLIQAQAPTANPILNDGTMATTGHGLWIISKIVASPVRSTVNVDGHSS